MNNNKTVFVADSVPYIAQQTEIDTQDATRFLKALANEARLSIVCLLRNQEMSVSTLNHQLPLSQSALSQHLAILRRDGVVKTRRESQTIFYSLDSHCAGDLLELLGRYHQTV